MVRTSRRGTRAPSAHRSTSSHSHQSSKQPAIPKEPQVNNIYVQRPGGGMLGTMAAVAGGSVLGHGISNMLFNKENPPQNAEEAKQVAEAYQNGQCIGPINMYKRCMEANTGNEASCKWLWEDFMKCEEKVPS